MKRKNPLKQAIKEVAEALSLDAKDVSRCYQEHKDAVEKMSDQELLDLVAGRTKRSVN